MAKLPVMPALASLYPPAPDGIVNLEHGYFGAMAQPVQAALVESVDYLNHHLSPFLRSRQAFEHGGVLCARLAKLINAEPYEILLTRSASESMQVLIGQYHRLAPGDGVLWSNLDYPAMRYAMAWLEGRRGVVPTELQLTLPLSGDALLEQYATAIRDTPGLKLLLLSQVFPANGQSVPVREIAALARARGVDVLVDSAHALGQLDVDVQAMGIDFAGFNLHKWIGAPPGLGFAYIRSSRLDRIEPHFGDRDYPADDIRGRLHAGMPPMSAIMAAPVALDVHAQLGGSPAKGARLAWLRNYWVQRVADLPGLQLMSPLVGDTALAAFTIDGMRARDVQAALLERFGVFTVERPVGAASLVRATVALTTTVEELDRLVEGLTVLTREAAGA
ncbi:selenocysteine lyase/cysteine desulfurase [Massilia aurea]|uniref:Selenocysteine lyase/cysteine desulfurase n=1 Tax=Massilia aurea TaxID=373040 RepID=A0A7W9X416_9BURK|nr:aminotransferase class V-fold PLP-dependent enzyme [Massilia aurea]MBB6136056.1 selenocysteine lyase/cysteine desulfurase [Massilia aurea]